MPRWAGLEPKVGDRIELRVVDASLASALFEGIPAARLLARVRLAGALHAATAWDERLASLVRPGSPEHERIRRATARHGRVALDEGPLRADEATVAVLVWALATDAEDSAWDASLAELAPLAAERVSRSPTLLKACAARDDRLATADVDPRVPAFEACVRLATRASLGPVPWERLRGIAAQLERTEMNVRIDDGAGSIFPESIDDAIHPGDRRMITVNRGPLDALVAKDPRHLGPATWRTEQAAGGTSGQLATFLADLTRLLKHEGALVAAVLRPEPADEWADSSGVMAASWAPSAWNTATAEAWAVALERGATTLARVHAAAGRGGEDALDALGAEMLRVEAHPFASAAFAEILAKTARPRDVLRLVTYFAVAPDPAPAAHALGACGAVELPRVLGAWLEAMLPEEGEAADQSAARVSACIASLKPYPALYRAVQGLLPRLGAA
jgi:hypothetical protein